MNLIKTNRKSICLFWSLFHFDLVNLSLNQTLTKVREGDCLAGYMQCAGTPNMVPQTDPIRSNFAYGSGLCTTCSSTCNPWVHIPTGVHPLITPMVYPSYPFPLICSSPSQSQSQSLNLSPRPTSAQPTVPCLERA